MRWKPWDWIAFLFGVTLASVVLISIIYYGYTGQHMSDKSRETFEIITTSMLSIVSIYIGSKIKGKNHDND
jgi:hypothetical protein